MTTGDTGMEEAVRQVGVRIAAMCRSDESYWLLHDGTWIAGGCWPLARAIAAWAGPEATLHALVASQGRGFDPIPQHVCVVLHGLVLDGNGAMTPEDFLAYWRDEEGLVDPVLTAYDADAIRDAGNGEWCDLDRPLGVLLARWLGPSPFRGPERPERTPDRSRRPSNAAIAGAPTRRPLR